MMVSEGSLTGRIGLAVANRRESERIPGPFDAWRIGVLHTPIRIYDISLGGCFVHAMHEQGRGVVVRLRIDLPVGDSLVLTAETLYRRPGFGFAVRFVDMDDQTRLKLARALRSLDSDSSRF
jgi:hypothetical protein